MFKKELSHLRQAEMKCQELADSVEAGDIKNIAAKLELMIMDYYHDVRMQSEQSFGFAMIATFIGLCFFLAAVFFTYQSGRIWTDFQVVSLISGASIHVIAGLNFILYSRAMRQFISFHVCLERSHRYIIAYSISNEIIDPDIKDNVRANLVCIMGNAPIITQTQMPPFEPSTIVTDFTVSKRAEPNT